MNDLVCPNCGKSYQVIENVWECSCGSAVEVAEPKSIQPGRISRADFSIWRYAHALPLNDLRHIVTMGEGLTPLVPYDRADPSLWLKLEYTNPTGSYKDRGVSMVVSKLVEAGIQDVVEDSSGNAGASLAAYTSRAGIHCRIFVPASHSSAKMKQIEAYGADLVPVPGSRKDTSDAAMTAAQNTFYASHAHSPYFVAGCKTMAYEMWEQMGGKLPDAVFSPCGQGSILIGLYQGFRELVDSGFAFGMPKLIAVQADACAPVATAFQQGKESPIPVAQAGNTIAEGIKIGNPVRGKELLRILGETNGAAISVADDATAAAVQDLNHHGFFVEPTSAVTLAGYRAYIKENPVPGSAVLVLTGSGLKSLH